jgi:hypothetical protein
LESAYEIRQDLEDVIKRVKPVATTVCRRRRRREEGIVDGGMEKEGEGKGQQAMDPTGRKERRGTGHR